MKYILIAVKDRAVDAFLNVQNVRAEGEAIRNFIDLVNNPRNEQLHYHSEDYDLYQVGTFDDETGLVEPTVPPKQLAIGKQAKLKNMTGGEGITIR